MGKNEPDHFGDCPRCFEEARTFHNDGHLNVRSCHFYICKRHKVGWFVGSNLFSDWKRENEKVWARNLWMLEKYYDPVEAYHPSCPIWELMPTVSHN